jgi:hypothetical protein
MKKIDGRRLVFKVEAYDEKQKIVEGQHERFIVHLERFLQRLQFDLLSVKLYDTILMYREVNRYIVHEKEITSPGDVGFRQVN